MLELPVVLTEFVQQVGGQVKLFDSMKKSLEARAGVEPTYTDLQSGA